MENIKYFENKNKISIKINSDKNLNFSDYIIIFQLKSKKTIEKIEKISKMQFAQDKEQIENSINKNISRNRFKKKKFYKKKFYKKKTK